MIHEVGVELAVQLAARNCPFGVVDGPEFRETTTFARERVVIEHDPNGDAFESRHLADKNPRTRMTRKTGVRITIFAKNPARGSTYWEHVRRAEAVLDLVLIGIDVVAKIRKNLVVFKSGKFVYPEDLKDSETPGGAKYELLFTFDRGVADRKWDGTIQPTTVISPYMIGAPALTFAAAGHTITRSAGSWITDGFVAGNTVIVSGSVSNNGALGPIATLTDTVMTFTSGVVNEGPSAGVTLTGNGVVIHKTATASGFTENGGTSTETV